MKSNSSFNSLRHSSASQPPIHEPALVFSPPKPQASPDGDAAAAAVSNASVPPSSPVSGEEPRGLGDDDTVSDDDKLDTPPKPSKGAMTAKNPKMSLENLMSPLEDHGHNAQISPEPATLVRQERVMQILPTRARRAKMEPIHAAHSYDHTRMETPVLSQYYSQCSGVERHVAPAESASLFANYNFGRPAVVRAYTADAYYARKSAVSTAPPPPQVLAQHSHNRTALALAAASMRPATRTTLAPYAASRPSDGTSYCAEPKAKRPWTESEDIVLRELVQRLGPGLWAAMAQQIPGRTGKQVRERWLNHLSPGVTKRPWSPEEDNVIIENHKRIGNCWSRIAKLLQGRSDNSVKNRYYTTLRRRITNAATQHAPVQSTTAAIRHNSDHKRFLPEPVPEPDADLVHKRARVWE